MKKSIKAIILPLSALLITGCTMGGGGVTPGGRTSKTSKPTSVPTSAAPTCEPTVGPTSVDPTSTPTSEPTSAPTSVPTSEPTSVPTSVPTSTPTSVPTSEPTSAPTSASTSVPTSGTTDPTSTTGKVIDGSFDGYYDLTAYPNLNRKGPTLQEEIFKLMLNTHQTLIKYSDFTKYTVASSLNNYVSIDQVSLDTVKNEMFYTGRQTNLSKSGYSREHVWPCAKSGNLWVHDKNAGVHYVDGSNYVGGGSDLYHVRPCDSAVNTARGDSRYIELTDEQRAQFVAMEDGGPYKLYCSKTEFSDYSEPADEVKGDIARLLVYVYVHYTRIGSYYVGTGWEDYLGTLNLIDVMGYNTKEEAQQILVKWNELDPVSETEKLRNDTVQKIQGNRNPFVDYPHLMKKMFNI